MKSGLAPQTGKYAADASSWNQSNRVKSPSTVQTDFSYLSGVDCDEVYPGIVLGNGATVKKKDYLKKIGEYDGMEERI